MKSNAVFDEIEMKTAIFSKGSVLWYKPGFDLTLCDPKTTYTPRRPSDLSWAFNEALTCLYVGLNRYDRGEYLSGTRFVQSYAVDIIFSISHFIASEVPSFIDGFQHERRYESRYPELAKFLPHMIQGYGKTKESAIKILEFIEMYHTVNPWLKSEILALV